MKIISVKFFKNPLNIEGKPSFRSEGNMLPSMCKTMKMHSSFGACKSSYEQNMVGSKKAASRNSESESTQIIFAKTGRKF
jgi:hypothetical protein